jgi:hypothetical protein
MYTALVLGETTRDKRFAGLPLIVFGCFGLPAVIGIYVVVSKIRYSRAVSSR